MFIDQYLENIKEIFYKNKDLQYAFIFGSILGAFREDSDVDFLVGGSVDLQKAAEMALEVESIVLRKVDIVPADKASEELFLNAVSRGIPLFVSDREKLISDYYKKYRLYEDNLNLRKIREEKIKRRYSNG